MTTVDAMTIAFAVAALKAAGLTDAHFQQGSINFTCNGKSCGIRTDALAQVKADDVAFWAARARPLTAADEKLINDMLA